MGVVFAGVLSVERRARRLCVIQFYRGKAKGGKSVKQRKSIINMMNFQSAFALLTVGRPSVIPQFKKPARNQ